jgi:hypothetical protein
MGISPRSVRSATWAQVARMRCSRFSRLRRKMALSVLTCTAVKERIDGGAQGGHGGHGGGEILGGHGRGDGGLGGIEGGEQGAFLGVSAKGRVGAEAVFHAVLLFGLRQDVVGALEPLHEVLAVLGFQERGEGGGAVDEQGQVVIAGHGEAGVDHVMRMPWSRRKTLRRSWKKARRLS